VVSLSLVWLVWPRCGWSRELCSWPNLNEVHSTISTRNHITLITSKSVVSLSLVWLVWPRCGWSRELCSWPNLNEVHSTISTRNHITLITSKSAADAFMFLHKYIYPLKVKFPIYENQLIFFEEALESINEISKVAIH